MSSTYMITWTTKTVAADFIGKKVGNYPAVFVSFGVIVGNTADAENLGVFADGEVGRRMENELNLGHGRQWVGHVRAQGSHLA